MTSIENTLENTIVSRRNRLRLAPFPIIAVLSSLGLLSTAIGNYLGREGITAAAWAFWIGLILVIVPIVFRLTALDLSSRERIGLVVLAGIIFYLIKIFQSPFGFTYTDEYVHSFNVTQIVYSGTLFNQNPILPVTPYFPGLEIVTAALVSISGMSVFTAGLIVIGVARLILMLSIYFFYEQVGRSARVAGLAAILYACNPNFLFWSSQFSYESLALPFVFLVLFLIARRDRVNLLTEYKGYTLLAFLTIIAVVFSHHISSYFLTVFLLFWALVSILFGVKMIVYKNRQNRKDPDGYGQSKPIRKWKGPGGLALLSLLLAMVWLFFTAKVTVAYFAPVFGNGIQSLVKITSGLQAPRTLFSSSGNNTIPIWQRFLAFGSVVLMILGLPLGFRTYLNRYRTSGIAFLLTLIGLIYFGILVLRLSPQTWEISNRASEFLFLGLAFLLAIGTLGMTGPQNAPWLRRIIVPVGIAIIFLGGVLSGWTPGLVFQQPSVVKADNALIVPQGQAVANWFLNELGPGNRIAADPTTSRLMLTYGDQLAFSGSTPDVQDILNTPVYARWQLQELQRYSIPYVVVDQRPITHNVIAAGSFDPLDQPVATSAVDDKFNNILGVSQILDSGNLRVFAMGKVLPK